jgi:GMP synthase (glutamine-hydrolysing)
MTENKTALVLSHLAFEDTGTLGILLNRRGFEVTTVEPAVFTIQSIDPKAPDLLIVLGGPIGVYDDRLYPHLPVEISYIEKRLEAEKPVVGICLGAQLMARALGARVYPSGISEIGWSPLHLTHAGSVTSLSILGNARPMFHWHGDTFDLPEGTPTLASTSSLPNQAFMVKEFGLALQFHPEIRRDSFERWLVGHAFELSSKGIDIERLRQDTEAYGKDLEVRAESFFSRWLEDNAL